jgi:GNAT superfamily N-acetyltransferase
MFSLRRARPEDIDAIERVMRESLIGISSRNYDPRQVESALQFVARLDRFLVEDGTYLVAESDGAIVGCGGWSRRSRLYAGSGSDSSDARLLDPASEPARVRAMFVVPSWARRGVGRAILQRCEEEARLEGFRRVELMAMLSGEAMYLACGYKPVQNMPARLEDGTAFPLTRMEKMLW